MSDSSSESRAVKGMARVLFDVEYEGRHIMVAERDDGGGLIAFEVDDSDPRWRRGTYMLSVKLPP